MDLYNMIWSPSIWVPPGHTWDDLNVEQTKDLWSYPFMIALFLIGLKFFVLTPFVFHPIGNFLKLRSKGYKRPPHNDQLEEMHRVYRSRAPYDLIKSASKKLDWRERQVQRWLRQRTLADQATTMEKFDDCAWQLLYYCSYCVFGAIVHYDKPWFYKIEHAYTNFPYHNLDDDVWWYYMIALGFYWCQTFTHFFQPKRQDSNQMLCHHIVTIALISLSFTCNFFRIGTLVLLVHECADIPLLIAKIFGYCGKQNLMDFTFVLFLVLWIVTRLGFFPFRILKSTLIDAPEQEQKMYPVYYIFNGLLLAILVMHIIWTHTIIQVIVRKFSINKISDVRSSGSEMSDEEESYPPMPKEEKKIR